jgi:hypothetical protein
MIPTCLRFCPETWKRMESPSGDEERAREPERETSFSSWTRGITSRTQERDVSELLDLCKQQPMRRFDELKRTRCRAERGCWRQDPGGAQDDEVGWWDGLGGGGAEVASEVQRRGFAAGAPAAVEAAADNFCPFCPPHSAPLLPSLCQPLINADVAPLRGLDSAVADSPWFPAETQRALAAPPPITTT